MGLFDFLFSSGVSNSQKKAHRNAVNNTSSDHESYSRGYEDGYDDCCCDHDCSYDDYHDRGYCDRDEYEGIENDMSAMTIIAAGSHLLKMDFSHYYIIRL